MYNLILLHTANQPHLEKIIKSYHANIDESILSTYHQAKVLGLKLDFDGCFKLNDLAHHEYNCFSFEGYANEVGTKDFLNSYNFFYNHVVNLSNIPSWTLDSFKHVQTALDLAATVSDPDIFLNKIKAGDLVIIPSGWDEHSISFVIHNDKLYRCNRGDQSDGIHGIEEYVITKPEYLTSALIQQMLIGEGSHHLLHLDIIKILGLQKIGEIKNPEQTTGNCVWTSLEAALEASFVDSFMQYKIDSFTAHYYGKQLFHLWEEYDHFSDLSNLIESKDFFVKNEIYDDLLLKALVHHHEPNNIFDIQKGSIILSQINDPIFHDAFKAEIGDSVNLFYPGIYNNISYISDYQTPSFYDYAKSWVLYYSPSAKKEYDQAKEYHDFLVACDKLQAENNFAVLNLQEVIDNAAIESLENLFNSNEIPTQAVNNSTSEFGIIHLDLWKNIILPKEPLIEIALA